MQYVIYVIYSFFIYLSHKTIYIYIKFWEIYHMIYILNIILSLYYLCMKNFVKMVFKIK